MELHPNQNHRVPVFAPLRMEGVEQECSAGAFLVAFFGYFRHWAGDGRHKRSRRQIQDETEETGACKNLYHFNSRQQNTTLWRRR